MVAILICDRMKWTLEEYLGTDAAFIDKLFQFMQIENEVRGRQNKKKNEQTLGSKSRA